MTHLQIVRSAMDHIKANPSDYPSLSRWGSHFSEIERALTRSTIDADFTADLWLTTSWTDERFAASSFGVLNSFGTLLHHMNITAPGKYWDYDGFSFAHSSRLGRDLFAAVPTLRIDASLSAPFGGRSPLPSVYTQELGAYDLGFKGSETRWEKLYSPDTEVIDMAFPPAHVSAEMAYQRALNSLPSRESTVAQWKMRLPSIGPDHFGIGKRDLSLRQYRRWKIKGLPESFDLLGFAVHMAQDLAMPHHVLGTSDLCHVELEAYFDEQACDGSGITKTRLESQKDFVTGSFDDQSHAIPSCQRLYSPTRIDRKTRELNPLGMRHLPISEILTIEAKSTHRWSFGRRNLFTFEMKLPRGQISRSSSCRKLIRGPKWGAAVLDSMLDQYATAVVITAELLERLASEYLH